LRTSVWVGHLPPALVQANVDVARACAARGSRSRECDSDAGGRIHRLPDPERRRRANRGGAVLLWMAAAAYASFRPLGAVAQCSDVQPVPLLGAVAVLVANGRRSPTRVRSWWRHNVYLGMLVHVMLNTIG